MSLPSLLIVGSPNGVERRVGRRSTYETRSDRRLVIRYTDEQRKDLREIATEERRAVSAIARDAINEYVSDYRERKVFKTPKPYIPE